MNLPQRLALTAGLTSLLSIPGQSQESPPVNQPSVVQPVPYQRCEIPFREFSEGESVILLGDTIPPELKTLEGAVSLLRDNTQFYALLVGTFSDHGISAITQTYRYVQDNYPGIAEQLEPVIFKVASFSDKSYGGVVSCNISLQDMITLSHKLRKNEHQVPCDHFQPDYRRAAAYRRFSALFQLPSHLQQTAVDSHSLETDKEFIDMICVIEPMLMHPGTAAHELIGHPVQSDFPVNSLFESLLRLSVDRKGQVSAMFSPYAQETAEFYLGVERELKDHVLARFIPALDSSDNKNQKTAIPEGVSIEDTAHATTILRRMLLHPKVQEDFCESLELVFSTEQLSAPQINAPTDVRINIVKASLIRQFFQEQSREWVERQSGENSLPRADEK